MPQALNPDAPVVPGQTLGTTPPTFGAQAGTMDNPLGVGTVNPGVPQQTDQVKRILEQLARAAQMRQLAARPQAPAVPGQRQANIPGYMAGPYRSAWGFERFANTVGTSLQNATARMKEKQIQEAEGKWDQMAAYSQELEAAKAGGNPQAMQVAQMKLDNFLSDTKTLKQMVKVFNQDWLSPEKTTAYGEAYKRVMAKMQNQDAAKKFAFSKLGNFFRNMVQSNQSRALQQMTPEERQSMSREIQQKMPMTQAQVDPKQLIELQKNLGEEAYRQQELGLREREVAQKDTEIQQNYQLHLDQVNQRADEFRQSLQQKELTEEDRRAQNQNLLDLRREQIQTQALLGQERIDAAKGKSSKLSAWKSNLSSLQQNVNAANRDLAAYRKQGMMMKGVHALGIGDQEGQFQAVLDHAKAAQSVALRLSNDVDAGKMTVDDAMNKVNAALDPSAKLASSTDISKYATLKKIPIPQAQREFESQGYVVY